jgi:diguanylate cyclase (GGDEF)-like protein
MGLTVIACIFCQMHLRAAALAMTAVTVIPFAIFFIATGRPVFIAIALSMLIVSAGMVYILLTFSRDFRAMIDFQRDSLHLANHDSLTGLPNRRLFFASLDEAIARANAADRRLTLGLIDIDRFKAINDLYGLAVGNRVLIEAARRLRALPGPKILFARIGGDEFTVIAENEGDDAAIQALGARICEALEAPIALPDFVVSVTASIGFAAWPEAAADGEGLLECAAYALDHAKRRQRGRATIFSVEHGAEIRTMAHIERCLRSADFDAEMSLHFQPIVDVTRDKVVAFEALARWVSPTLGRVAPDAFIKVAERSDLINKLTRTLLRAALAEARTWPDDVRISFNLSMRDLTSPEAIAGIVAIVESSGVAPGRLDLEVTETALIQDFETADESLRRLKALGVGISLDDFGTGYSSLSYVQQFPIDKIKIDRSFVRDVETKPSCRAIVKSVIDLCRNLKLTCIVEGMETREQVRVLRALGCTTMQGYLFGRPMPANEVRAFLAAREALAPPFAAVS